MHRRPFLALLAGTSLPLGAAPNDAALWRRLREGGHVLLMRHAATDPGIGDALRRRGIPIGEVLSSRWCRCLDTARLVFGRAEPAPMLDSMFRDEDARRRGKVAEVQARAGRHTGKANLVLVTHDINIRALVGESVAQGDIVVTRPAGTHLETLGVLPAHG